MKVTIFTLGSRGDIEPFLALAVGLQEAGHLSTLVAPVQYSSWINSYGVRNFPLSFDIAAHYMEHNRPKSERSGHRLTRIRRMARTFSEGLYSTYADYEAASKGADLIIQTGAAYGGLEIAQREGAALAFAQAFPTKSTREFPSFLMGWQGSLGPWYNLATHRLIGQTIWSLYGRPLNRWRRERLGLRPWKSLSAMLKASDSLGSPTLFGYSPAVIPPPADWNKNDLVTGYWHLPLAKGWTPDPALVDFIESGQPPVFVGFGSIPGSDAKLRTDAIVKALTISGQRGVISIGGGGALGGSSVPGDVFYIQDVPYNWLFPRMAAIIHHAGAGTTATGLRAGVPMIVLPAVFDNFLWADRIVKLGVGLRGDRIDKLNAEDLATLISRLIADRAIANRAASVRSTIAAENGVESAVGLLQAFYARHRR